MPHYAIPCCVVLCDAVYLYLLPAYVVNAIVCDHMYFVLAYATA